MILSFSDKETERVFNQDFSVKLPVNIQKTAVKKLIYIDTAKSLNDLRKPASNHLEKLLGKYSGKWSIKINDQWRICFVPVNGGADYIDVEIVDYH